MRASTLVAVWLLVNGVWPFADPGHAHGSMSEVLASPVATADWALHLVAGIVVGVRVYRWVPSVLNLDDATPPGLRPGRKSAGTVDWSAAAGDAALLVGLMVAAAILRSGMA